MQISIGSNNAMVMSYLGILFKDETVEKDPVTNKMTIALEGGPVVQKLKQLVSRRKLVNIPVSFTYNAFTFEKLGEKSANTTTRHRQMPPVPDPVTARLRQSLALLNCDREASMETVQLNYRRLIKTYHPDRVHGKPDHVVAHYTRMFQQVQEAYRVIKENMVA